jgi:DNA invertase Pin-like site-specific DNA recombinase
MFTVLAGMAEYERELVRSRINDKLNVKRGRGELTGTEPYGFTAVETGDLTPKGVKVRKLVDNPEEQKWILEMVRLRHAGYGYHRIAKHLNAHGVPTKHHGEVLKLLHGSRRKLNEEDKRFPSGQWQAGNVASVLNSKPVQAWLASLPPQAAA